MALGVVDRLGFYNDNASVVEVASGIYAIAGHRGTVPPDGWLATVSIGAGGSIGDTVIDSFEFDTSGGQNPHIVHVSGDIFAIAYEGPTRDGVIITVEIDSAGNITEPIKDSFEFFDGGIYQAFLGALRPHIIHISGDIYAIAYCDFPGDPHPGVVITVDIDSAGNIEDAVVGSYTFDANSGKEPYLLHISGTTYAIAYSGTGDDGFLKTITIGNDGSIAADPLLDTLEFDTLLCWTPSIAHVSGDIYAIAYTGPGGDGWLITVDIDSAGNIENEVVHSYEFDEVQGNDPHIIKLTSGLYAIAYRGVGNDGFVITIAIADNGTIGAIQETLEYDTSSGYFPYVFEISADVFAIACNGYVRTIATPGTVTTQAVTDITGATATGNGNITDLGTPNATQHGHCWSTYPNPDVGDDKTENGVPAATGAFTSSMTGLVGGTKYYVRAYVATVDGSSYASYGGEVEFTTPAPSASGSNPGVVELLT